MSLFLVLFSIYYHIMNFEIVSNISVCIGCSGGYLKTMDCKNETHFMSILGETWRVREDALFNNNTLKRSWRNSHSLGHERPNWGNLSPVCNSLNKEHTHLCSLVGKTSDPQLNFKFRMGRWCPNLQCLLSRTVIHVPFQLLKPAGTYLHLKHTVGGVKGCSLDCHICSFWSQPFWS